MKKILSICICTVLLFVCYACGISTKEKESFWEGSVRPGSFSGSYEEYFAPCHNYYNLMLTINEDHSVEFRETGKSNCGSGGPNTKIYYGRISKHEETYNGERKVWYGVTARQDGGEWETRFNLSTSLEYSGGDSQTYQNYSCKNIKCKLH